MLKKVFSTLAVALTVGLAGTLAAGTADAAPKLKKRHFDPGIGIHRIHAQGRAFGFMPHFAKVRIAKRNAIMNWRNKVAHRIGPAFSSWRFAEGKRVDCFGRFATVVCEVSAYPRPAGFYFGAYDAPEDDFGAAPGVGGDGLGVQVTIFE